ncbi:hypothetical protein [Flavobacterium frigoris]|uniref:Uncharacterized protein n=1 Tax=Flavobacterium frigoris TaxID=229204 RepID=A0A1H9FEI7_FLAFI|nr:hypothetical protein [Flavobacterium frigoris]SEQ35873.1 hypothetical protein SAMN05444355_102157 [Flavobacterium frigoris]
MNIEAYKNKIIKKLIDVQDKTILEKIDTILNGDVIVARTIEGKTLTKSQYVEHIESISESVADGAETYTSEEVKNHVLGKKK